MADLNDNTNSTPSVYEELGAYPALSRTSTGEGVDDQVLDTSGYCWGMPERPGLMLSSSTGSRVTTGYEPVASASSYKPEVNSYGRPTYSSYYQSTVGHQAQSHNSAFPDRGGSFPSTMVSGSSTVVPNPSGGPLDYWRTSHSRPSMSTFYTQNVRNPHQPGTGPTRTGSILAGRFQPYKPSRARANEYRNAGVGPSTLVPPPVPYVGSSMLQPSGGISETTADADENKTTTEEDKAPTTERTRLPHGQGPPRQYRVRMQEDAGKLRAWLQEREGFQKPPSLNRALDVIAKIIPTIRPLASQESILLEGQGERSVAGSKYADKEFERRKVERKLLDDLSQYYPLEQGQNRWSRSSLLSQIVGDLENLPTIPGPFYEPDA